MMSPPGKANGRSIAGQCCALDSQVQRTKIPPTTELFTRVLLKASWHCEAAAAACGSCESSSVASVIKQALKPKLAPDPLLVSTRLSRPAAGLSAAHWPVFFKNGAAYMTCPAQSCMQSHQSTPCLFSSTVTVPDTSSCQAQQLHFAGLSTDSVQPALEPCQDDLEAPDRHFRALGTSEPCLASRYHASSHGEPWHPPASAERWM